MNENQVNQYIQTYTAGELKSFSELYTAYAALIRSAIFRLCEPQDLDDLIQDVFLKIWKALPNFKQNAKLKTWIYRIAYHVAIDHLRNKKNETLGLDSQRVKEELKETDSLQRDLVRKSLNRLSEEHRTVLVLYCMEGLAISEVAEVMNVPEGTVKSRLFHAREHMQQLLTKQGVNYE